MTFTERINKFTQRFGFKIFTSDSFGKAIWKAIRNLGRVPAYAGRTPPPGGILEPQWNYVSLYKLGQNHHILRRIVEAIIRECMKNSGEVVERFASKCTKCGTESMKELEVCPCGGKVRPPDPEQKKIIQAFIDDPNRDGEWLNILISLLRYSILVDDWYLFAVKTPAQISLKPYGSAEKLDTNVLQVFVLDSRYVFAAVDKYGQLGNNQYFCPICYDGTKADTFYDEGQFKTYAGKCPTCKGDLLETYWVWREVMSTQIKGRFGRSEVIHGNLDSQLPHIYGMPKTVAALRPLHTVGHMTRFNLENYATGKVDKMVIVSGMNQEEVNTMVLDAKQQAENRVGRSTTTGQLGAPELHTLTIGIDDKDAKVTVVEAMPDPQKMQSLEWYKQYVEDICGIFGVTPTFEGIAEAGKAGVRVRIDVETAIAEMYQKGITDRLDETLWPEYLKVTDWMWHFNEIEQRDALMDARIKQLNVDTAIKAKRAGLTVELEETGELKVSGIPEPPEPPPFTPGGEQQGEKPEGMEVKPPGEWSSSVERPWEKKGKTWLVKEIEPDKQRNK